MKHSFRTADFDRLATFWNDFAPDRYALDAELIRRKTVECPVFDWGASCIEDADGEILAFASIKQSASSLYKGPDQDVAHLSLLAFADPSYGIDILSSVKQTLRNRGFVRLAFGQDSSHFFPGCPTDFPALSNLLMVEGFGQGGEVVDLERDLADYVNPCAIPGDGQFRPLESTDRANLAEFLDREFPGRWKHDVLSKFDLEGPSCVFGLFRDVEIDGFALIQTASDKAPTGGAVWRNDLGENWGSLGPIGVSASLRGRGYGHALLGCALTELRNRGARQSIIDWTGLVDFYGRHGFEPTRRYHEMSLLL